MSKKFLAVFLVSVCSIGHAQKPDWVKLAETDEMVWDGRVGTREFGKTRSGKEMVVATGRTVDKKTKRITFEKWYVLVDHCRAGQGQLTTVDMDGAYKYETDFMFKGGTVASSLAEMLCYAVSDRDGKGI